MEVVRNKRGVIRIYEKNLLLNSIVSGKIVFWIDLRCNFENFIYIKW